MYEYVYASGKLLRQTYGNNTLDFFYDNSGLPFAMSYNGTMYYYITNLQGDVVMMVDADGDEVACYTYDPYGKILTATGIMADINPLRYRGYYYDAETGMYYLQSRYYDPVVGRFINADAFVSTGQSFLGYNMFAYCLNNPVFHCDIQGMRPECVSSCLNIGGGKMYITDQDDETIGSKRLGIATISHGGCGVVASYNALITLGDSRSFDEVLSYYNKHMPYIFGAGLLGIPSRYITKYFTDLGYTVTTSNDWSQICSLSQSADACIMYYEFPRTYHFLNDIVSIDAYGGHYIEYHRENYCYLGLNTNASNGKTYFDTPSDYGCAHNRYNVLVIFINK